VWGVGPTSAGNNVYRFSDTAVQHTRTASGNVTCTPIPPFNSSVCQGFTHTVSWQAGFGNHYGKQLFYTFQGPNSWNAKASVNQDDIFAVMENPGNYQPSVEGSLNCSEEGTLFNDAGFKLQFSLEFDVFSQFKNLGTLTCYQRNQPWSTNLFWYCSYSATPACSSQTTPPDLNVPLVEDIDYVNYGHPLPAGWFGWAPVCGSVAPVGSRVGTWVCPKSYENTRSPLLPSYPCTQTP